MLWPGPALSSAHTGFKCSQPGRSRRDLHCQQHGGYRTQVRILILMLSTGRGTPGESLPLSGSRFPHL